MKTPPVIDRLICWSNKEPILTVSVLSACDSSCAERRQMFRVVRRVLAEENSTNCAADKASASAEDEPLYHVSEPRFETGEQGAAERHCLTRCRSA